ncbi:MAG: hypothetical protein QFF03_21045 [Pseudomonadota bacterium]|nr:hypothetical protein [Pseudomonadota bacterium]
MIAAAGALLLAGCTTPQERAARNQADMDRIMVEYGPACIRLGYAANTDQWRNCLLQLSTKDDIERYGYSARISGGFGHGYWGGGRWGPGW